MATRSAGREPTVDVRRHRRTDGSVTESWSVRFHDADGRRRRRGFASREDAEFERARLALEAVRPPDEDADEGSSALVADRTPVAAYRSISAPLLILRGDAGPAAPRRASALVAQGAPDARLRTIAGAGHMGPLTHRDAVNDAIVSHIETAAARANA